MRLSTYVRIKQLIVVCTLSVCILTLLSATGYTSPPVGNTVTDLSDYVSRQFQNRFQTTQRQPDVTTSSPNVTSTTQKVVPDLFHEWFEVETKVEPFKPTQTHPFLRTKYLMNSFICNNSKVDVLIYIQSTSDHFHERRVLRDTWASTKTFKDISIRVVFIVGKTSDEQTALGLKNEHIVYGDVIQGDFVDSFRNLTLKAMTALKWINDYCIHARYVIKADDDMFVNIFKVLEDVIPTLRHEKLTVFCHYHKSGTSRIIRSSKDKWFVPKDVLPDRTTFPDFCSGYFVLMTPDIIPLLYRASFHSPFVTIDDAYLFGVLPLFSKKINYIDGKGNFTLNSKTAREQYMSSDDITFIVAPALKDGGQADYWAAGLNKLSPWAKAHANIVSLRSKMGPTSL